MTSTPSSVTTSTEKYSEFLLLVAAAVNNPRMPTHICHHIQDSCTQYRQDYRKKLRDTIGRKLAAYNKAAGKQYLTLTSALLSQYKIPRTQDALDIPQMRELRVRWLTELARCHAAQGN